ncbi:MAG: hypothetical protein JWM68_1803 [Verrucomicrobiales bacterium]|nr:hypothetical protein [Verrucomicrobiales bacterium]
MLVAMSALSTNVGHGSFGAARYVDLFHNDQLLSSIGATVAISAIAGTLGALAAITFVTACYFRQKLYVAVAMSLIAAIIPGEVTALGFLRLQSALGFTRSSFLILIWALAHYSGAFCALLMAYVSFRTDSSVLRSARDIGGSDLSVVLLFLFKLHGRSVFAIVFAGILLCAIEFPRTSMLSGSTEFLSTYFVGQLRSGTESSTFALAGLTVIVYSVLGVAALLALQKRGSV